MSEISGGSGGAGITRTPAAQALDLDAPQTPVLVPVPDVAAALGIGITRVHQLLRERTLVGLRADGVSRIPSAFVQDGLVVKGLPGTITLLTDAGFDDAEIIDWLFRVDPSLPGSPIQALRENRGREVHRRAQVAGF